MKPRGDSEHDRAFKVKLVLNYFNVSFINGMSGTAEKSTNENVIKFKGHNILKQNMKRRPVQWIFKL